MATVWQRPESKTSFSFLNRLVLAESFGSVIIKFEAGRVTHVRVETCRTWQYNELPAEAPVPGVEGKNG